LPLSDARGWYEELTRLYKLSIDYDLGFVELSPNIIVYCRLGEPGEETETEVVHFGLPTVEFVGPNNSGYWLPSDRLPAIIVNVNAPSRVISEQLKRMLAEIRKHIKPPVRKRGRYSLNDRFDYDTFRKWIDDRIVEFADLLAWNAAMKAEGKPYYSEYELGKKLDEAISRRMTSEKKRTLKKALASLPALAAQIAGEWDPEQRAQKLTAAEVAKKLAAADLERLCQRVRVFRPI